MYSMSVDLLASDLTTLCGASVLTSGLNATAGDVRILQHFQTVTSLTMGGSLLRNVMHSAVAKTAWDRPYLMHMVLAVSAAHMKWLTPASTQAKQHQEFAVSEAMHWQIGLELYQAELARKRPPPPNTICTDFDPLVSAAFLAVIITFALDKSIPIDALSSEESGSALQVLSPMAAAGGFSALRCILGEFDGTSDWAAVLMDSDDRSGTFTNTLPGIDGLPAAFVSLCDLNSESTCENSPYHSILRRLAPLLRLVPDTENFGKLIAFIGRTWLDFRPLILRKDPRALLLLAWWLTLLGQVDQWWISERARSECAAIVHFLSTLRNPRIQALLPFPAPFGETNPSYIY
ncbi:hypothetical protein H2203_009278 [Taxawa tesnikishii (nom. ined.)]|nr:hypothetical protein H2203_009278 [Dothideales sp. JES 119]